MKLPAWITITLCITIGLTIIYKIIDYYTQRHIERDYDENGQEK